ncbi:YdcF family protein [Schleiferilactobacillus harbinensis]|uniref:DUF218 domain-containing protein n=1 Tax=Schleiferilactobacillus harbinensis DSM 16991 TaxID=1122147 RepID=A0A0R1X5W0_9LACO|nr:YdcF family protein [Schleiferilactobacillus harbinensis]KRM25623.1 hypothetical protein FC91_GL000538 [Schleiferilactobacillus harbinensis DSM 16991]QFR62764.1 YdcF family protein [Schleiferilactobacillus harbinensis]
MLFSELNQADLTEAQCTALLFRYPDDGAAGDVIMLAGSRMARTLRLPTAVALYQAGRAPRLLISGGRRWQDQPAGESMALASAAEEMGVPASAILTENKSQYTLANVRYSKALLADTIGLDQLHRIILVTNAYHMNRLYHMMRSYFPAHIAYSFHGTSDPYTRADNWFASPLGRRHVHHELSGLQQAIRKGEVSDYPVPDDVLAQD